MCELFACSAATPISVRISLEELARHGGATGPHRDGWGAAFYQGRDVLLVREPQSASQSACMQFLVQHAFESPCVIAHVRKAVGGERTLANTQPFIRELGGRTHIFAHNGVLRGIEAQSSRARRFHTVGETDSERAFCLLLERLAPLWGRMQPPPLDGRRTIIADFFAEMRNLGPANFIYSDGDALFAHADRRTQADGGIRPPGLHWYCPSCAGFSSLRLAGVELAAGTPMALIASVPLSDARWLPLEPGELLTFRDGQLIA